MMRRILIGMVVYVVYNGFVRVESVVVVLSVISEFVLFFV